MLKSVYEFAPAKGKPLNYDNILRFSVNFGDKLVCAKNNKWIDFCIDYAIIIFVRKVQKFKKNIILIKTTICYNSTRVRAA